MAINFLNNIASIGTLTITKATTDPLLYLYNTTNGSGATIRFSDQTTPAQVGDITYFHSDGSSQGGGASFHFRSEPDTVVVAGGPSNTGRFVSKSKNDANEVDYGFYDDVNTGMYRTSADNVSLVAGGVRGIALGTTAVSIRYAGSTKLATVSGGVDITGNGNFSGDITVSGGDITLGGAGRIQGVDTVSANTDAANKLYVDNAVAGVPIGNYLPLSAGAGSPLTGTLYGTSTNMSGAGTYAGSMILGNAAAAAEAHLTIGQGRTGNGYSYIDLVGDATYTDYGFRMIRGNGGANTTSELLHRGTGNFSLVSSDGGDIVLIPNAGNVGIGTTNPNEKLDVAGKVYIESQGVNWNESTPGKTRGALHFDPVGNGAANTGNAITFGASDTGSGTNSHAGIYTRSDGTYGTKMYFATTDSYSVGSKTRMMIDHNGNVGIGTTSPLGKLQVNEYTVASQGNQGVHGEVSVFANSGDESLFLGLKDSAYPNRGWAFNPVANGVNSDLQIKEHGSTGVRMIIQTGGNVGIGTTSPGTKLHIVVPGGSSQLTLERTGGSAGKVVLAGAAGGLIVYDDAYGPKMYVGTSGTYNGNVGIGTISPTAKLHVAGTGLFTGLVSGITPVAAANFVTKAYADAGNARVTPATPSTITSTIVGETIEIAFNQSSTSNIDYYQVWSSDDGGDYGIIAQITPADFSSTMTVVDTTFVTGGTMSYRVFAVKEGIYSTAGTTSKAYTVAALSVTDMTVVNLNTAYYIQYEKPTSRFIDHVEIYMDSQTTSAALSRSNATIVYSGQNASYMRNVNTSSNFHQFWVEIVTS